MEWLNTHLSTLRAPEYIGCEPVARATWLNVLGYCCEQENGGRIIGAANWKCRQWQQACGVTLREVQGAAPLVTIEGDDILVWRYPIEKQAEVQARREAGARGGRAKSENRQREASSSASSTATSSATSTATEGATGSASTEGNGKEGKGKKPLPPASPEGLEFADWFLTLTDPKLRLVPKWREQWAKLYDDLLRLDSRDPDEVRRVCEWARRDVFWSGNFITPMKLRARNGDGILYYDVIKARMGLPSGRSPAPVKTIGGPTLTAEERAKRLGPTPEQQAAEDFFNS